MLTKREVRTGADADDRLWRNGRPGFKRARLHIQLNGGGGALQHITGMSVLLQRHDEARVGHVLHALQDAIVRPDGQSEQEPLETASSNHPRATLLIYHLLLVPIFYRKN